MNNYRWEDKYCINNSFIGTKIYFEIDDIDDKEKEYQFRYMINNIGFPLNERGQIVLLFDDKLEPLYEQVLFDNGFLKASNINGISYIKQKKHKHCI